MTSTQTSNKEAENLLRQQLQTMRRAYQQTPYPSYQLRKDLLLKLKKALIKNEAPIRQAMTEDYGYRSNFDSLLSDILPSVRLINYSLKHLKEWMKPSKRHSGLLLTPSKVKVHYQPLGVIGVITPWNFPFYLALGPTIQALAAGNRVMIKMSEATPKTNKVLKDILKELSEHVHVVEGVKGAGSIFSTLPFDHIIFTGSTAVGKMVAKSASKNLTPITLELGGKSPTIIAEDANMEKAVDAVILGKSINSGQICVAPDYIMVHQSREKEFVETFIQRYRAYHVEKNQENSQTHIINDKQLAGLQELMEDAESKGAKCHPVKAYETGDGKRLFPQLFTGVSDDMLLMKQEIFGSILPIMTYDAIEEVIDYINSKDRPLALYIMSNKQSLIDKLLYQTHSGGVSINDTAMHVMADDAPFGGIGHSGMGHYHGHEGFLTFSKAKTVLTTKT